MRGDENRKEERLMRNECVGFVWLKSAIISQTKCINKPHSRDASWLIAKRQKTHQHKERGGMKNSLRKGDDKSAINLIELTDLAAHAVRKRINIYIAMHATDPHPIRSHICRVL